MFYYGVYSHKNYIYGKKYSVNQDSNPKLINLKKEDLAAPIYVNGLDSKDDYKNNDITHVEYNSSDIIDISIKKFKSSNSNNNNLVNPLYIDYQSIV